MANFKVSKEIKTTVDVWNTGDHSTIFQYVVRRELTDDDIPVQNGGNKITSLGWS